MAQDLGDSRMAPSHCSARCDHVSAGRLKFQILYYMRYFRGNARDNRDARAARGGHQDDQRSAPDVPPSARANPKAKPDPIETEPEPNQTGP